MEYDKRKTSPESVRKFLVQQVQEQDSCCDVKVKMGYWEKRFHRCVLATSPFFDIVLNTSYLEKQTGKIEINFETPITLETAVMFLYGKRPKFTLDNIEEILNASEYLLIQKLKASCIAWLKLVTITDENCMRFLQLSSIYDFEIPNCTVYIKEHLPEMLMNPQMLNLTKDSIHLLFSDKRLSYVPMDDKLSFLLRWTAAKPDTRKLHMHELLPNIDFREISPSLLQEVIQNPDIAVFIKLEQHSVIESSSKRVLIMKSESNEGTFWCLDFEKDQWYCIESKAFKEERSCHYANISGTCTRSSESVLFLQRFNKDYQNSNIVMLNLQTDSCSKLCISMGSDKNINRDHDIKINGDICATIVNEHHLFNRDHRATLYIGHIGDGDVEMLPLLSFKDAVILLFLVNQNTIGITFESKRYVIIYNLVDCKLDKIEQETNSCDKISQFKDGYLIYDNERCISFTRKRGPCLSSKYDVAEIQFEQDENDFSEIEYFVCGEMFYRYFRINYEQRFTKYILECIPCHTVLSRKPEETIAWKQLPLPKEAKFCSRYTINNCFEICLPKSKLRCHIECPHCKLEERLSASRDTYDYFFTNNIESLLDIDCCLLPYYDSDFDFHSDSD